MRYFFLANSSLACILVGSLLSLASCTSQEEQKSQGYYDVKGFVNAQIELLNKKHKGVNKRMAIGDKRDRKLQPDVKWEKELELFVQADINKKSYSKSYQVLRSDSLSFSYALKKGENLPVQALQIKLDGKSGKPHYLHAVILSKNRLYDSRKDITFTCAERSGEWRIVSYRVSGYQKLSLMDQKDFVIEGSILD